MNNDSHGNKNILRSSLPELPELPPALKRGLPPVPPPATPTSDTTATLANEATQSSPPAVNDDLPQYAPQFSQPTTPQPQQQYTPPQPQQQYIPPQPQQQYIPATPPEETTSTTRQSPKPKKGKGAKANKNHQQESEENTTSKKPSSYAGKRKNVIIARVALFGVVSIFILVALISLLPKNSGLTSSDGPLIISRVRENLNVTDFPRTQGEGFALSFAQEYLTYDPDARAQRLEKLRTFVAEGIINVIEPRVASEEEKAAAKTTGGTGIETSNTGQQEVTDGPYLVGSTMFKGGSAALFTVSAEINNNNWVNIEIPVYYNTDSGEMSVSGSITFGAPTAVVEAIPPEETTHTWSSDSEIVSVVRPDISNYIQAWTNSDAVGMERFLLKENSQVVSTPQTQTGLDSSLQFIALTSLDVEAKEDLTEESTLEEQETFYIREAEATVTMLEPSSNLIYTVKYQLVIQYANQDWFIKDIQNVASLLDRDSIIATQNASTPPTP